MHTFGERLKNLIDKNGLDQQKFAEIFNLSKQAVTGYVKNRRTPNDELKKKIADYFGVTVDYLVGRETEEKTIAYTDKFYEAIKNIADENGLTIEEIYDIVKTGYELKMRFDKKNLS